MPETRVRFTSAAIEDLQRLVRKNRPLVKKALEKCLLLEQNPYAGQPLHRELAGYRKLTVANRHLRIVWKVITDEGSDSLVSEVAEIWAVGVRPNNAVYDEMRARIAAAPATKSGLALGQVVSMLDLRAGDAPRSSNDSDDPVPDWLRDHLLHTVGLTRDMIDVLSGAEAFDLWNKYMSTPKNSE